MEITEKQFVLEDDNKSINSNDPLHQMMPNQQIHQVIEPEEQIENLNIQAKYYQEFKKIYFTAYKLKQEILKQRKNKENLLVRITHIETQLVSLHKAQRYQEIEEEVEENQLSSKRRANKRTRRTAQQIQRKYYCVADFCDRCYGSQGSLQQHIKLKHPELYHREDEQE